MPTRTLAPVLHYLRRIETDAHGDSDGDLLARFVRGDEATFATLLRRHGPMVFGVCRRVLRDGHEAEDAFQATFLVLVRKASSLAQPERLGPWLHGVAYRIALKARARARRRAACGEPIEATVPASEDVCWRDLRRVLDAAIDELPARYRSPFVLCHLQGMTNAQAARQLGCPEGTVVTRLARARQRLRIRLARYGPGAAGIVLAAVGPNTVSAIVPTLLLVSTLRIVSAFRLGSTAAVPATVATLMEGACSTMLLTKVRTVMIAIVLAVAMVGATGAWAVDGGERDGPAATAKAVQAPQPAPTVAPAVPQRAEPVTTPAAAAMVVVRTENFVVHAPSRRIAQLAADAAERLRTSEAIRWFGKELPAWTAPCSLEIVVRTKGAGHCTTLEFANGTVLRRKMLIDGPLDQVLSIALPHEMTHALLADHFGRPVVRWADEGAAMMAEDEEEQERHRTAMQQFLASKDRLIPLRRLLPMQDYPSDATVLHVQGYSLTRFLVERKDRKTFLAFVKQGMNGHWEAAAQKHYAVADVAADLEQAVFNGHLPFGLPGFDGFAIEEHLPVLDPVPRGGVRLVRIEPGRGLFMSGLARVVVEESEHAVLGQRIRVIPEDLRDWEIEVGRALAVDPQGAWPRSYPTASRRPGSAARRQWGFSTL